MFVWKRVRNGSSVKDIQSLKKNRSFVEFSSSTLLLKIFIYISHIMLYVLLQFIHNAKNYLLLKTKEIDVDCFCVILFLNRIKTLYFKYFESLYIFANIMYLSLSNKHQFLRCNSNLIE